MNSTTSGQQADKKKAGSDTDGDNITTVITSTAIVGHTDGGANVRAGGRSDRNRTETWSR